MGDKNENLMASHIEKITLGISKILESSPGVTDVKIEEKPPAERHTLVSWEQTKHSHFVYQPLVRHGIKRFGKIEIYHVQ
ncbi:unnamed protein product [Ranitomeya imitator]|uniref:Uncharacterized protein n=1 Tax=Ranitomeya imitator TaxID=111125 RepID=A0ABN9MG90_9NEOB|nr:unnamed protein product [Ranitomeya imitator]